MTIASYITGPIAGSISGPIDTPRDPASYAWVRRYGEFAVGRKIEVADHADFNLSNKLTVMCWAQNDNASMPGLESLIDKYDTAADKREWLFVLDTNQKPQFWVSSDGTGATQESETAVSGITSDSLHHLAATYDGAVPEIILYVDGSPVASTSSGTIPSTLHNDDQPIRIGATKTLIDWEWQGNISDMLLYGSVLTPTQIAAATNRIYPPGAVGYWAVEFDALDRSGNGHDGTATAITYGP